MRDRHCRLSLKRTTGAAGCPLGHYCVRAHGLQELQEGLRAAVAIGETVILLQPLLPVVGVSIGKERERQQNDSLANG